MKKRETGIYRKEKGGASHPGGTGSRGKTTCTQPGMAKGMAGETQSRRAAQATKKSRQKMYEEAATGNPEAVERYENYLVTRRESYHRKKQEAERTA